MSSTNCLKDEDIRKLYEERLIDIKTRGENHYVYDNDGKVVKLKEAKLWCENNKYVKPLSSEELYCTIS